MSRPMKPQSYPAQPYPAQPYPAQPNPAQPYPAQPYPAQGPQVMGLMAPPQYQAQPSRGRLARCTAFFDLCASVLCCCCTIAGCYEDSSSFCG